MPRVAKAKAKVVREDAPDLVEPVTDGSHDMDTVWLLLRSIFHMDPTFDAATRAEVTTERVMDGLRHLEQWQLRTEAFARGIAKTIEQFDEDMLFNPREIKERLIRALAKWKAIETRNLS